MRQPPQYRLVQTFPRILQHLNGDDLTLLNNDQRIILASHRFAPEVTSAALWLNKKASNEDLITCVQLTPYHDASTNSLYVQATTIIPVPGLDEYIVGIGASQEGGAATSFATKSKLARTFGRNRNDETTHFLRGVVDAALGEMSDEIKPSRTSRWAGQGWSHGQDNRYYHAWYSKSPSRQLWGNWDLSYRLVLFTGDNGTGSRVEVEQASLTSDLRAKLQEQKAPQSLSDSLKALGIDTEAELQTDRVLVKNALGAIDEESARLLATTLRAFMETLTPLVDGFEEESNEEDA